MSTFDEVKQIIGQSQGEITAAVDMIGQAQSQIEDRAQRFADLGAEAVADALYSAAGELESAAAQAGTAHTSTDETIHSLAEVSDQGQIDALLARATAAVSKLSSADNELQTAASSAESAVNTAQGTGVEPAAAAASSAVTSIEQARSAIDAAKTKTDEYRQQLQDAADAMSALNAGDSSPRGSPAPATTQTKATQSPKRLQDFRPGRNHADAEQAIRREGWPRNAEGRISARANLYDDKGNPINTKVYRAHRKGHGPHRPELTPALNDPNITTTWHVEGDIAKDIRDANLKTATVYLNVPLCGYGTQYPDPERCAENFRHIIPKDTVSYVFIVPEHGTPRRRKVIGTGEGIK